MVRGTNKLKHLGASIIAAAALNCGVAVAQAKDWDYTLSPLYLWAVGLEGESQIGPVTAPIDVSFDDAFDNLDAAFTIHFEAKKGRWGYLLDFSHIALDPESSLPNGAPLKTEVTNNIIEAGGIYQIENRNGLEVLFGIRYSEFELEAEVGGMPKATVADESWADGFVGLRANYPVGENGTFTIRGDIGTGDSDLVWNALLLYDHRFRDNFSMLGGYRWLDYDYETGIGPDRFTYDITYEGPVFGLVFHW